MGKKDMGKNIVIITFAALLLRLCFVFFAPQQPVTSDAAGYDTIACNLVTGHGFSVIADVPTPGRAPGYPFFLSIIFFVFGHKLLVVRVLQTLLSALTVTAVYYITREVSEDKYSPAAAWMTALYPPLVGYSGLVLSETLFTFMLVLTILTLIRAVYGPTLRYSIISGALLGMTTLVRPTTIIYLPVVFLVLIIARWKDIKTLLFRGVLITAAFVFSIAPWTWRNYRDFGVLLPVASGGTLSLRWTAHMAAGGTFEDGVNIVAKGMKAYDEPQHFVPGTPHPRILLDRIFAAESKQLIKSNMKNYLILVVKRIPKFWLTSHSSIFGVDLEISDYYRQHNYKAIAIRVGLFAVQAGLILAAAAGIFISLFRYPRVLLLTLTLVYFTQHIAFDPCQRYHIPVMPYAIILASIALYSLFSWKKETAK